MMNLMTRLRAANLFFRVVRDPNRTDLIFKGVEIFTKTKDQTFLKEFEENLLNNEAFRTMYDENYIPPTPELLTLKNCPENSFGIALYNHMRGNKIDFNLFPVFKPKRPVEYLSRRVYQDHDLWHALLNCGTSVEDELAVQAFGVAQFKSPIGITLIAGGLLHLLGRDPRRAIAAMRKINYAFHIGETSPFILGIKLHELFNQPLTDVRRMCLTGDFSNAVELQK